MGGLSQKQRDGVSPLVAGTFRPLSKDKKDILLRSHLSSAHSELALFPIPAARYFDLSEPVRICDADLISSCTDTHRSGCNDGPQLSRTPIKCAAFGRGSRSQFLL
jgi:hypothetical protein